ncbi:MAG: alanine racemase, partial [Phycisphaerae bacterium]
MPRPTCAEIRLGAIRHNLEALRSLLAPGVKVLGVVKADGYGHGVVPVARTLQDGGIDMLGVALVEEGVELREAGVAAPILVMGTIPRDEVASLIAHDLRPTVVDEETAREIDREAARQGQVVQAHLKVDTGMNRLGVRAEEAVETAEAVARLGHLRLEGVYTHFACAEE